MYWLYVGMGLGLVIVKEFVMLFGGVVVIEDVFEGGVLFVVDLFVVVLFGVVFVVELVVVFVIGLVLVFILWWFFWVVLCMCKLGEELGLFVLVVEDNVDMS